MASSTTFLSTLVLFIAATLAFTARSVAAAEMIEIENWYVPYSGPKEVNANVGDSIVFKWNTGHNVYIHPAMSCALDGAIFVGDTSPTEYTFTDADGSIEGTDMFFGCDIGNGAHCRAGQNLIVTVYSDGGGPSSEELTTEDPNTFPPTSGATISQTVPLTVSQTSGATGMDTVNDTDPATDAPTDAPTAILPPNEFEDDSNVTDIIGDDDFVNATDGNATDVPSVESPAASINAIIDDSSSSTSSHHNSVVTIAIGLVGTAAVILLV